MRFPSINDVAKELRDINANVEDECDVRLQVYDDGAWIVHSGLSDYDQDHRGFWGASNVPGVQGGVVKRFSSTEVARDLLEQVKDAYHERG